MKTVPAPCTYALESLNEDDIRDYAYHLYVHSGCVPGRDLENWLEAEAYLSTLIQTSEKDRRSRDRVQKQRQQAALAKQAA